MNTYMALRLSGTTTVFYQQVPVIERPALLGHPLTGTYFGFPLWVPIISSILYISFFTLFGGVKPQGCIPMVQGPLHLHRRIKNITVNQAVDQEVGACSGNEHSSALSTN